MALFSNVVKYMYSGPIIWSSVQMSRKRQLISLRHDKDTTNV